jgi:hypothetical protein
MTVEKNGLVLVDLYKRLESGDTILMSKKLVISTIYDDKDSMANHLLEVVNIWKFVDISEINIRTEHTMFSFSLLGKFRLKEIKDL